MALLPTAHRSLLIVYWCPRRDSNPEPTDYESAALTVELQGHKFLKRAVYHEVSGRLERSRLILSGLHLLSSAVIFTV